MAPPTRPHSTGGAYTERSHNHRLGQHSHTTSPAPRAQHGTANRATPTIASTQAQSLAASHASSLCWTRSTCWQVRRRRSEADDHHLPPLSCLTLWTVAALLQAAARGRPLLRVHQQRPRGSHAGATSDDSLRTPPLYSPPHPTVAPSICPSPPAHLRPLSRPFHCAIHSSLTTRSPPIPSALSLRFPSSAAASTCRISMGLGPSTGRRCKGESRANDSDSRPLHCMDPVSRRCSAPSPLPLSIP